MHSIENSWFIVILFSAAVFVLYLPAMQAPFVFDDITNIEQNKNIRLADLSFSSLKKAAEGPRPAAMLSFALNYHLHGLSPLHFRIGNILIHICTAVLLHLVLRHTVSFLNEEGKAENCAQLPLLAALLWAVHPLQIQSVTYIVQRMNSLAGLLFLLSMLLYIHARQACSVFRRRLFILPCTLTALAAAASKPNAAVLPLVLLLYEWFFLQKRKLKWHPAQLYAILAVLLLTGVVVWHFMRHLPAKDLASWYAGKEFTPAQRIMTEFRVVIFYLSLIVFPHPSRLNIDHDISLSTSLLLPSSTLFSFIAIIALFATAVATVHRLPLLSFGIFWFFINLAIESTIIPLDLAFEHRNYIPSMMLIAGMLSSAHRLPKNIQLLFAAAAIGVLSLWTHQRNAVWQSGLSLWQDSVMKSPNKSRPHESLAYYLEQDGRVKEARQHYERAAQLDPKNATARYNLGNICMKTGAIVAAIRQYESAARIDPKLKEAYNNIGVALCQIGKLEHAVSYYEEALKVDQNYFEARTNLKKTLELLNR